MRERKPRHLHREPWVWGVGPRSVRITEKAPRSPPPAPPPRKGWPLATLVHCPCLQLSCPPPAARLCPSRDRGTSRPRFRQK